MITVQRRFSAFISDFLRVAYFAVNTRERPHRAFLAPRWFRSGNGHWLSSRGLFHCRRLYNVVIHCDCPTLGLGEEE